MSQQPSGWYDDPSNPDQLRYWDGVTWTDHTAPKKSPTVSQSTIGYAQPPTSVGSDRTGAAAGQGPAVPSAPQSPGTTGPWGQPQQGWGGHQSAPSYPHAPQSASWMHPVATTVDGVPLASWGKRLLAWILDGIIIFVLAGIAIRVLVPGYYELIDRVADAFATNDPDAVAEIITSATGTVLVAQLVTFLVASVYAVGFWVTTAQTPGKMATGISVRRADRPGPLDLGTAIRRRLIPAMQIIPFLSNIYPLVMLVNGLWPLWDEKRQALHDKIAHTQVVVGKQPRNQ